MSFKRILAFLMILVLALSMLAGCGSKVEEESGMIGEFVEGEDQEIRGDKPEKGEESEIVENEETDQPSEEQEPADKNEQKPSDKDEQKEEQKEEQKPADQEDEQEEQKPSTDKNQQTQKPSTDKNQQTQKPSTDKNQQTQKPNNNQQQTQKPSQNENVSDEDWEDDDNYDEDESFLDEDGDGEPDEGYMPGGGSGGGGTPILKPGQDDDAEANNKLKIVAYNVRVKDDGNGNDLKDRQPRFKAMVEEYKPDIMALSEAGSSWIHYLENNVLGSKYQMIYTYRAPKSAEAQPLIFDKTKFQLMDSGYFWLSETPDVASKGWGGEYYRGATWAKLKVKSTGLVFLYYSTHLTGDNACSVPSAKLIYQHALDQKGFTDYAVFVSGDFNITRDKPAYAEFTKHFVDVNAAMGYDPTVTYSAYKNGVGGKLIDYVMCSPNNVVPQKYMVMKKQYLGGHISDHYGIYVEATLN